MSFRARITAALVILWFLPGHSEGACVSAADRAVVMLHVKSPDFAGDEWGAGVIFAVRGPNIFIATARHVVKFAAPKIEVSFQGDNQKIYQAQILQISKNIDIAFLEVQNSALAEALQHKLLWQLLPAKDSAVEAEYASIIGNNSGRHWSKPAAPEPIISRDTEGLTIDSRFVRPGSSGGGVFDPNEQLLGIENADTSGAGGLAIPIESVLHEARQLGLPIDLQENRLATPAVFVAAPIGAPGDWGSMIADAIRQKLGHFRRVIECENERAISMRGTVEIRSPTLLTDVAVITWQLTGLKGIVAPPVTQYIEVSHFLKHVNDDPNLLTGKTDEAADFALAAVIRYLGR